MKKDLNNDILVYIQFVLCFVLVTIYIVSLFINELQTLAYCIMGVLLIVMAINNARMKKNKILTVLEGTVGILIMVMELL